MIKQMVPLLERGSIVVATIALLDGNRVRMTLNPTHPETLDGKVTGKPRLKPVILEGTPEEFDSPDISFGPLVEAYDTMAGSIMAAAQASKAEANPPATPAANPPPAPAPAAKKRKAATPGEPVTPPAAPVAAVTAPAAPEVAAPVTETDEERTKREAEEKAKAEAQATADAARIAKEEEATRKTAAEAEEKKKRDKAKQDRLDQIAKLQAELEADDGSQAALPGV